MSPLLLVVTGPPASGKTTIARELAGRLGLPTGRSRALEGNFVRGQAEPQLSALPAHRFV